MVVLLYLACSRLRDKWVRGKLIACVASKAFPFGFGAKKDRETGFSVLAALVFISRAETLATQTTGFVQARCVSDIKIVHEIRNERFQNYF